MTFVPRVLELLKSKGADDVRVVVAGTIPLADAAELDRLGVTAILRTGTEIDGVGTPLRPEAGRPPGATTGPHGRFGGRRG